MPLVQSGLILCSTSMASAEFALLPKPLSCSTMKVPSPIDLRPEKPCIGWPLNGSLMPVSRGTALSERNDVPMTLSVVSMRFLSALVNLPDTARSAGASAGGLKKLNAGTMA